MISTSKKSLWRCTMESDAESNVLIDIMRSIEPWVWPATAAIVVGGSIISWTLIGTFWLAAQRPIVIQLPAAEARGTDQHFSTADQATIMPENRPDVRAN